MAPTADWRDVDAGGRAQRRPAGRGHPLSVPADEAGDQARAGAGGAVSTVTALVGGTAAVAVEDVVVASPTAAAADESTPLPTAVAGAGAGLADAAPGGEGLRLEDPTVDDEGGAGTTLPMEEASPMVEEASPMVEEASLMVEDAAPAVEDAVPAVEDAAPAVEGASPAVGRVAPAVTDAASVVEDVPPLMGTLDNPMVDHAHASDLSVLAQAAPTTLPTAPPRNDADEVTQPDRSGGELSLDAGHTLATALPVADSGTAADDASGAIVDASSDGVAAEAGDAAGDV
eukprot:contig_30928_g7563